MYYFAAWTDSGFLFCCSHEHKTVADASSCIGCAGGYVVGVENTVMRALTRIEEHEFQCAISSHFTNNPAVETILGAPAGAVASDSGYAVMVVVDHWTWTTWMRFGTHPEAAAHAREGNKVVLFQSPEWVALRRQSKPASPIVMKAPRENLLPQGEGETLLEFVLRFLTVYGFPQEAEPISDVKYDLLNIDMIGSVLNGPDQSETSELERMYAEDGRALLETVRNLSCPVRTLRLGEHRKSHETPHACPTGFQRQLLRFLGSFCCLGDTQRERCVHRKSQSGRIIWVSMLTGSSPSGTKRKP